MLTRHLKVLARRAQRDQVPFARQKQRLARLLPARDAQQFGAQQVDAQLFVRRQIQVDRVRALVLRRLMARQVDLVPDAHHRHVRREGGDDRFIAGARPQVRVQQVQDHVGLADLSPGALDADALDHVDVVADRADAGGVDDIERDALDLDRLAHLVARGPGNRCDDGHVGPGQRIEKRGLADIRLPDQHHIQAFAQQRALRRLAEHVLQRRDDPGELAACIRFFEEVDFFFREVERGFDQHAQIGGLVDQRVHDVRERAGERLRRRLGGSFGGRVDQVGHRLGLGQVELVVQKSAAREFARFGQAQIHAASRFQHATQQHLQHDRTAVALQFEHVFTGVRMRTGEVQGQAFVDDVAVARLERDIGRVARRELHAGEQGIDQAAERLAGGAHDADTAAPWCGGDGGDGRGIEFHGGIVRDTGASGEVDMAVSVVRRELGFPPARERRFLGYGLRHHLYHATSARHSRAGGNPSSHAHHRLITKKPAHKARASLDERQQLTSLRPSRTCA